MAICVTEPRTMWWRRYADRVHRPPQALGEIVRLAVRTPRKYPHIRIRIVNDKTQPFILDTGLAVWEIVWLLRVYEGDMDALMEHLRGLPITRELVGEALAYAKAHAGEIDPVVTDVETMTLERLRELLPGIKPFPPDDENDANPNT